MILHGILLDINGYMWSVTNIYLLFLSDSHLKFVSGT